MADIKPGFRQWFYFFWLQWVPRRHVIHYIGNIEASSSYQYLREEVARDYDEMSQRMPDGLRQARWDVLFRNVFQAALFWDRLSSSVLNATDEVMARRLNETLRHKNWGHLLWVGLCSLGRNFLEKSWDILRKIKWQGRMLPVGSVAGILRDIPFDCLILSQKFIRFGHRVENGVFQAAIGRGLKPLLVFEGLRLSLTEKDGGWILEVPVSHVLVSNYRSEDKALIQSMQEWVAGLPLSPAYRSRMQNYFKKSVHSLFHYRAIYGEIFGLKRARSVLSVSENVMWYRVGLVEAQARGIPTIYFHTFDGIELLTYQNYFSDLVLVPNGAQQRNFAEIGYALQRCQMVGSPNYRAQSHVPLATTSEVLKTIYFTKATPDLDEAILRSMIRTLDTLGRPFEIIIKKHPKDPQTFAEFTADRRIKVVASSDYWALVEESGLIVTQYSGVLRQVLPLGKPLILYTYSDLLEFGERAYFTGRRLPNYFRYVQTEAEFAQAVREVVSVGEPDPLPEELARDIYGYLDERCFERIAEFLARRGE